jgi:hypothetical protein
MAAMRSPQEVFGHHAQALGAEDAFVFRDGLIRVQTVRDTLQPAR